MHQTRADIAIFGGGIAGLWILARLRQAGFSALLFESKALGGVQTIASQGIIHGGAKYALTGNLTESARAIGEMPGVWRACLEGKGELDLSLVRVLCDHQYLWSSAGLVSRMAGFFASKAMRSRMTQVEAADRPEPFRHQDFSGTLYRLEEQVLDVASLVGELSRQFGDYCYLLNESEVKFQALGSGSHLVRISEAGIELEARRVILAAGQGNANLLRQLGQDVPEMQLRPLHMVVMKGKLPPLFAHCLGSGATPRITITSCPMSDGRMAWYLGGQLAEGGNDRTPEQQITQAQNELSALLPWMDFTTSDWSTLRIDRAEPRTAGGMRPDGCFLHSDAGVFTTWPTKLAFAPRLAGEVLQQLQLESVTPKPGTLAGMDALPHPSLAPTPWESAAE